MLGRTISLGEYGCIYRRWWRWSGYLLIPGRIPPLELRVGIDSREPIEPFVEQARYFAANYRAIQAEFAGEMFETYQTVKQLDLEDEKHGFTEADYAEYPQVTGPENVWRALTPTRIWLGEDVDKYLGNSYLMMDVDWPNPHYFQVFMLASQSGFKYMHTEFVG